MAIESSKDYQAFRRNVALQRITISHGQTHKIWKFYDFGPKKVRSPLICIPSASGGAECYFKQVYGLATQGYRVIAVEYPDYWTHESWCEGFTKFIDFLHLDKVHLFGAALGGFLAQIFSQYKGKRVESLVLCNTFADTNHFQGNEPFFGMTQWVPEFLLKKTILSNFPSGDLEPRVADSVDFMVQQLEKLDQAQVASRLKLNTLPSNLHPNGFAGKDRVTIIEVLDEVAITQHVKDELSKFYPEAKVATLKSGGNFCYVSRGDEVNMHIKIHLRPFAGTKSSPLLEEEAPPS